MYINFLIQDNNYEIFSDFINICLLQLNSNIKFYSVISKSNINEIFNFKFTYNIFVQVVEIYKIINVKPVFINDGFYNYVVYKMFGGIKDVFYEYSVLSVVEQSVYDKYLVVYKCSGSKECRYKNNDSKECRYENGGSSEKRNDIYENGDSNVNECGDDNNKIINEDNTNESQINNNIIDNNNYNNNNINDNNNNNINNNNNNTTNINNNNTNNYNNNNNYSNNNNNINKYQINNNNIINKIDSTHSNITYYKDNSPSSTLEIIHFIKSYINKDIYFLNTVTKKVTPHLNNKKVLFSYFVYLFINYKRSNRFVKDKILNIVSRNKWECVYEMVFEYYIFYK
ncbi:hypothetical protein NAPIS_ORF02535 [Vairimorpha apis BRL 01]|uniref:Uncharacterized protein n=1 Tax=Vairimorpha apis BRL 01 TaxID=1037528 RepID=T0L5X7_9MICR|nr:hypothetical protein NAPIS_ORF02535 [Vairimorpha apis BRL 01]